MIDQRLNREYLQARGTVSGPVRIALVGAGRWERAPGRAAILDQIELAGIVEPFEPARARLTAVGAPLFATPSTSYIADGGAGGRPDRRAV